MTTYSQERRAEVMAELEINGGNIGKTARLTGVPDSTVRFWSRGLIEPKRAGNPDEVDFGDLWAARAVKTLERIEELIPTASFRDLSIFAGIAADKHLDYTVGRKSIEIKGDKVQVNFDL